MLFVSTTILFLTLSFSAFATDVKVIDLKICSAETGFGNYTNTKGNGTWQRTVKESVKDLNVTLTFIYTPRGRCLLKVKKGGADAVYAGITPEKKLYLQFPQDTSKAIDRIQYKIYKKRGSSVLWDGKKFTNLGDNAIGVQRGVQIEQLLRTSKVKVDGDLVTTPEQNLKKLHLGRIVAAAVEEQQGDDYIKQAGLTDIEKFEKSYSHPDIYLAFSKQFFQNNQDLVEKIWNNIKVRKKEVIKK